MNGHIQILSNVFTDPHNPYIFFDELSTFLIEVIDNTSVKKYILPNFNILTTY
jgi:hypothetical protein